MNGKSTARKTIDSYTKHEDLIDNAVKLGRQAGLDVSPTEGNDPKGISLYTTPCHLKLA